MTITTSKQSFWLRAPKLALAAVVLATTLATIAAPTRAKAQDDDDPPGRVARLGYLQGSVSFAPAGETEWVEAVPNRPLTTGDQLWTDEGARAEVQLGSAVIRLGPDTSFSFLNLDDNTVQVQVTSGTINVTVRRLGENETFEIDTPNQAFTVIEPGKYRIEVGEDGDYTAISVREGLGTATGDGQSYELRGGQRGTISGTDQLEADVEQIYEPDEFDTWAYARDHRYDYSPTARYLSHDVVGFDDLDDNGDWRDDPAYGHVWFPNRVEAGWAPYHVGHWAWINPWGWTWVDDNSWGYAPFHYGRWVSVGGRWGWVAGPVEVRPVYAPALVVFIGGGPGAGGFGGNVGWFPLGPREVYVPSYHVSEAYVTRVNVSSTTVNVTQVTNVYRTTIVNNNTTTITNVTYANRNVQGAVMVVPQHAFVSAQPVAKAQVQVSAREIAAAPMAARVSVAPTREAVMGAHAATAGHVAAPPAKVVSRQVVAKKTPPPPPVPFAKQQQALAAHPGQPLAKSEVKSLRPAAAARPAVKVAPPAKPATPHAGPPPAGRPGANAPKSGQPAAKPGQPAPKPAQPVPPAKQPPAPAPAQPSRAPAPAPAQPNRAPAAAPPARPEAKPEPAKPAPAPPSRPQTPPPNERQQERTPPPSKQAPAPAPKPAPEARPAPAPKAAPVERPAPAPRPAPPAAKPAPPPQKPAAKPMTPAEKKQEEERKKKEQQKPPGE